MDTHDVEIGMYMDSDHLHSDDGITLLSGSRRIDQDFRRDLKALDPEGDLEYWHEVCKARTTVRPVGTNWCSCHDHEGRAANGEDDGGWRPLNEFTTYRDRNG